jgi:hypothetical protein
MRMWRRKEEEEEGNRREKEADVMSMDSMFH